MRLVILFLLMLNAVWGSNNAFCWQQQVNYTIHVDMDVHTHKYKGIQMVSYKNNSDDTLKQIFIHAYNNAFQPYSMMDERSRYLGTHLMNGKPDWDGRIRDRILHLTSQEQGYLHITNFKYKDINETIQEQETIIQIPLHKPIAPHQSATFEIAFEGQVPIQIRRSGRNNTEGVNYSMAQWYPKICAYDQNGWHPTPYVAREFYGEFGKFDVTITIDKKYYIASTGNTQTITTQGDKNIWHIRAEKVHDFVWAADTAYVDISQKITNISKHQKQFEVHVVYKKSTPIKDSAWHRLLQAVIAVYPFIAKNFGEYPYTKYSFIQGGDGGMEYPMATLIKTASTGTAFHEWMHSWYQGVIATNESLYPWMDEGFATYAENLVSAYYQTYILKHTIDSSKLPLLHADSYNAYFLMQRLGLAEPLTTHADYYHSNLAYGISAYGKGSIFLTQLGYIVGDAKRDEILYLYYEIFKFKHPMPNDFLHLAQQYTQIQLDWYKEGWINSTRYIDYAIDSVYQQHNKTMITLSSKGDLYMPIDLMVTLKNGEKIMHYIPLYTMFGQKDNEDTTIKRIVHTPWKWTTVEYTLSIEQPLQNIASIEIDPSQRMADVNRANNIRKF